LNCHRHATRNDGGMQAWLGLARDDLYTNTGNGEGKHGGSRGMGHVPTHCELRASVFPSMNVVRIDREDSEGMMYPVVSNNALARWCIT